MKHYKFITGLISGLLIGLLLSTVTIAYAGSPIKLVINGKQIACEVPPQIIGGKLMVPARNIAESLGATVQWDGTTKTVTVNGAGYKATPSGTVPSSATGNIKGTITYQYNKFIGSRGDVGANVFLINKNTSPYSINYNPHVGTQGGFTTKSPSDLYRVNVDGLGHYEINNIPAGDYIIIIRSSAAFSSGNYLDPGFESLVKPLLDNSYETFIYGCKIWKSVVSTVTISPNSTSDYSYDFGYSAL